MDNPAFFPTTDGTLGTAHHQETMAYPSGGDPPTRTPTAERHLPARYHGHGQLEGPNQPYRPSR